MNIEAPAIDFLEQIFEDDVKCDCKHSDPENLRCSEDVSFSVTTLCDHDSINVCVSAASVYRMWMRDTENVCEDCDRNLYECWTIHPI